MTVAGLYAASGGGAIGVQNAGTTLTWNGQITGSGTLVKFGAGTLALTNTTNHYAGGAVVEAGTLAAGTNGAVFPVGSTVTVQSGATFDLGPYSNASAPANALGLLALNAGTLRATGATNSDFFVQQITMTAGTIDFTNMPFTWIHVSTANGITIIASATPSTWIGGGTCRVQNDTAAPLTITAASGASLNAGMILSNGGTNPNFTITGAGVVRLSNTGNTANITVNAGTVNSSDLSTNVGAAPSARSAPAMSRSPITPPFLRRADRYFREAVDGCEWHNRRGETRSQPDLVEPGQRVDSRIVFPDTRTLRLQQFRQRHGHGRRQQQLRGATFVGYDGVLAVPTIANGGVASPIGTSSNAPTNLELGYPVIYGRGDLLLTGTNANYSTDRGVTVRGQYGFGGTSGGAIGVQNAGTTLTWNGQITGTGIDAGELIKTGAGTLVLTNTANNFAYGTVIEGGTLTISGPNGAGILPAGSAVAIVAGAQLNYAAFIDATQAASALDTIFNEGGTFRLSGDAVRLYLNQLWCYAGSTMDLTTAGPAPLRIDLINSGAAINVLGNSTWTGPGSYVLNTTTAEIPISIAPNATLTSNIDLASNFNFTTSTYYPYRVTGGGTLYLTGLGLSGGAVTVSQGRLRVDSFTPIQQTTVTLDGGTFQFSGPMTSSDHGIYLGVNGGTVEVTNAATTLTLTSYIGSFGAINPGPFTKGGPGVLALTYVDTTPNRFLGGVVVNAGRLEIGDDAGSGQRRPSPSTSSARCGTRPPRRLRGPFSSTTARWTFRAVRR